MQTIVSESATHKYEVFDKYNKEYEYIHSVIPEQPTPTTSDNFQLTKCLAYASTLPTKNN